MACKQMIAIVTNWNTLWRRKRETFSRFYTDEVNEVIERQDLKIANGKLYTIRKVS